MAQGSLDDLSGLLRRHVATAPGDVLVRHGSYAVSVLGRTLEGKAEVDPYPRSAAMIAARTSSG